MALRVVYCAKNAYPTSHGQWDMHFFFCFALFDSTEIYFGSSKMEIEEPPTLAADRALFLKSASVYCTLEMTELCKMFLRILNNSVFAFRLSLCIGP